MRNDLVEKYQHYFNESVKLQKLAEEQSAYIAELEEALTSLDEGILDKIKAGVGKVKAGVKAIFAHPDYSRHYAWGVDDEYMEKMKKLGYSEKEARARVNPDPRPDPVPAWARDAVAEKRKKLEDEHAYRQASHAARIEQDAAADAAQAEYLKHHYSPEGQKAYKERMDAALKNK